MSTTIQNPNGNGDNLDCIQIWEEELEEVNNALLVAQAECDRLAIGYTYAGEWENKLKGYWEGIEATNRIVNNIANELELFSGHTAMICGNIECIAESIGLAFCIMEKTSRCLDEARSQVNKIISEIECLNIPAIAGGNSLILSCLYQQRDQMEAAAKIRKSAITQLMEAWKCVCLLQEMICNECFGLVSALTDLRCLFGAPITKPGNCDPDPVVDSKSCNETINCPMMPPACAIIYADTKTQYENAQTDLATCKEEYDKARESKETLLSCRNGLKEAIDCAKAAKNC